MQVTTGMGAICFFFGGDKSLIQTEGAFLRVAVSSLAPCHDF